MVKAFLNLILVTLIWGSTFPIHKIVLTDAYTFPYLFVRFFIACILSFIIWRKQSFKYGAVLGIVLGIAHALQTYGINFTDASKSGFITSLYIPLTPIISYLIEKEKPNIIQWLCFPLALVGSYMLFGGILGFNYGDFLTLLGAVLFALHIVLITKFSKIVKETSLLAYQFLIASIINFSMSFNSNWYLPSSIWLTAFYTSIFATIIVNFIQVKYQKVIGSNSTVLIFIGEPIFASLFSFMFLGERFSFIQIIGASIMILVIIMTSFSNKIDKFLRQKLKQKSISI
ncbi:DMT family transporter [Petrotoga sp. 9PWA.NaAc.5.4]|uniref:DMT family transporter n=1 Tax=Petrotoga sp. 9PWA.NaAc.5.4 TaxID=1434328 RepID=UPI000CBF2F7C|nr:DMT family transporter [Petrotoga sp. 9PWA.NaAc.5.4]PNR92500.1 membrane protein [Petrotoga sp. 9PWA.NaAc.5.4]